MTKPIPTVQRFMTTCPLTIGVEQTLFAAEKVMAANHVRHLPVLAAGQLRGLLTQRDIHLVETLDGVDPRSVKVEDAMLESVYAVTPDAPLDEVVREMAEHKYGCAVVMQNEHVVGVLTTVDVCRALAELLHGRLAS